MASPERHMIKDIATVVVSTCLAAVILPIMGCAYLATGLSMLGVAWIHYWLIRVSR